jgi:hypothetical protein
VPKYKYINKLLGSIAVCATYTLGVGVIGGGVELSASLRMSRAAIIFVGAYSLVVMYEREYGEITYYYVARDIFFCLVTHGFLMLLMYNVEWVKNLVFSMTSARTYLNDTVSIKRNLRNSGLTYGLAQTSMLQGYGILLSVYIGNFWSENLTLKIVYYICAIILIVSIPIAGRSGALVTLFITPILYVYSRGKTTVSKLYHLSKIILISIAITFSAYYLVYNYSAISDYHYYIERMDELVKLAKGGIPVTVKRIMSMYFLPEDATILAFGSSKFGRGPLGYIDSDVGYVRMIFAYGVFGTLLHVITYLLGIYVAYMVTKTRYRVVGAVTIALFISGLILHLKGSSLFTRNQWQVQSLMVVVCGSLLSSTRYYVSAKY